MNESIISSTLSMENSDNEDSDTEFCENALAKFKTLLKEVNF